MAKDSVPVLFDTDIGSDIDDAVALGYLLKQPRCEIVGITTVSGDTAKRAALAEVVCRAGGREDIPIHAGLKGPILNGPGQPEVPQYDAVKNLPHRTDYPNTGLDFMRRTIRERPGEITLLAVGPMTNVGALFAGDPELPGLLKQVVLMCGVFTGRGGQGPGTREWNALVDPVACALVFHHAVPQSLLSVGLEVTTLCKMPADECRRRFTEAGGALGVVGQMAETWFKHAPHITFHDPLAATLLFEPGICSYAAGTVDTITTDGPLAGLTRWIAGNNDEVAPHRIALTVDAQKFFDHYFGVVSS